MTTIRKFVYATLLVVTALNVLPSAASAEEPSRGRFTLTHDVLWESATVPAGEYAFSYDPNSVSPVLTITKITGTRASFMMMVLTKEDSRAKDSNILLLERSASGSYVSAMQLPESGVTLRFWAPRATEKQLAKAENVAPTVGQ